MHVILLDKIRGLGELGDTVVVKPGYGRNYLIPQGKAVFASDVNRAAFQERRQKLELQASERLAKAQAFGSKIQSTSIDIQVLSSSEGKLYGSVGVNEVASCLEEQDCRVPKKDIQLPEGVIHHVGEYPVVIHLHPDVLIEKTVRVASGNIAEPMDRDDTESDTADSDVTENDVE